MSRTMFVVCVVSLAAARPADAQLVNGNFNSPSGGASTTLAPGNSTGLTGWTVDSTSELPGSAGIAFGTSFGTPSVAGLSGTQSVQLGTGSSGSYKTGGIQQAIATVPGQEYSITIYATGRNTTPTAGTLSFGGQMNGMSSLSSNSWSSFTWTGTATSSSTLIDITGNTGGTKVLDQPVVADLSVVLAQVPTVWSGSNSSDWGTVTNWYNTSYVPDAQGIAVTFGTAGANGAVSIASGSRTAGILNFVNSVSTTISGGANYLILDDTGGASPSAAINVSGSHSISANIQLDSPAAVTIISGTDLLTVSGVMANGSNGAQGLSLAGSGTLNLSGANTMSGAVSVNSGTLLLSNNAALQNATFAGGSPTFAIGITAPIFGGLAGSGNISLTTTASQTIALSVGNNGQSTTYSGVLGGGGSLTKIGGGALTLKGANTFNGTTLVSGGTLLLGNANALQNSNLDPSGAGTVSFGGLTSATLGGLINTGTLNLVNGGGAAVTLSVGNNNLNSSFAGSLRGSGSLTKIGNGTLYLSGSNTYAGTSAISAGTLQFLGGNSLPSGSLISLGQATLSLRNDGGGSGGTISVPSNVTLSTGAQPAVIDVGNLSGHTGNTLAFGVLSNGTSANALNSTIDFTAANGYRQSFTGLNLPGSTGQTTELIPTTTTVIIQGGVTNLMTSAAGAQYDTVQLDGVSLGNTIFGAISDSAIFAGVGYGDTRLTKSNVSQWILAGSNTYSGPTTINGGTLQLGTGQNGHDGSLYGGGFINTVTDNAALVYNLFGSSTAAYSIVGGAGSVIKMGQGSITLGASNSYTGATNIAGGTLALGSGGSILQSSAINLAGGATFDVTQQFGNFHLVSGQTLSGTGSYTVNDAITADGGSTILPGGISSAGTLSVGALTLSPSSVLNYNLGLGNGKDLINVTQAAGLTVDGGGVNLYQANGTTPFSTPGTYLLMNYGNGNFINGSADSLSVLNPSSSDIYAFAAAGGSLTVTIVAPNVWTGGANPSFNWSNNANWSSGQAPSNTQPQALSFAGTVGLNNTNNITGLNLSGIFFSSSAAFNISGNDIQLSGPITNLSTGTQTIGLNIQLMGSQTITAAGNKSAVVLNGVISDGGQGLGLSTAGLGTVVLGGSNTFSGTTNITSGKLLLTNPAALQNSTANVGAVFGLNFATGITSPTLGGLSGGGNVALATATGQGVALNVGGNGQSTTYSGVLSSTGGSLIKQGGGTLSLAAPETYTGATVVSGGVLQLVGITGFGGSGAGWTLSSTNSTLPSVVNDVLTLTFSTGNEARSAFLNQQVPVGAFTASFDYLATGVNPADGVAMVWQNSKSGANALGVTGGGLGYGGISPSAAVEININNGGLIRGTNYATNGATGTYHDSSPVNTASGDPIRVTLNYDGVSTLTETMSDLSTNQTYSTFYTIGNLASTVSGGLAYLGFTGGDGSAAATQTISNFSYRVSNILPTSTALLVTNGATFDLNGANQTVGSLSSTDGLGSKVLLGGGALNVAGSAVTTFDGVISDGFSAGNGSLIVQGGRLTLTGQNTYSGATTIAGGTLQLTTGPFGQDGTISSSLVNDNGTLLYNFNDNQTVAYPIAGQGSLRKAGAGALTLTANNSYLGATAINGGTLQLGDGTPGDDGSIAGTSGVTDNGVLAFDLAGSQTASYHISGSGSLTMVGTGMLTLSGSNTYGGGTYIAAGTVVLANNEALADGSSLTVGDASFFPAPVVPSAAAGQPAETAVPEPGALVLLGAGALVAGAAIRRRKRKIKP